MYGRTSCGTMSAAYAVAASWRPASMISNVPLAGTFAGDTFFHVLPPSAVGCTRPLLVPAQRTLALADDAENDVIAAVGRPRRWGVCGGPARAVRSGLISFHVMPPSVVDIMNCVP